MWYSPTKKVALKKNKKQPNLTFTNLKISLLVPLSLPFLPYNLDNYVEIVGVYYRATIPFTRKPIESFFLYKLSKPIIV